MSLLDVLPTPKFNFEIIPKSDHTISTSDAKLKQSKTTEPPPYLSRQNYLPKSQWDYGDGGAFPEIACPQYPLGLGLNDSQNPLNTTESITPLRVNAQGKINHSAILTQHQRKTSLLQHSPANTVAKQEGSLNKPSAEQTAQNVQETKNALENIIQGKIRGGHPRQQTHQNIEKNSLEEHRYIRFTPSDAIGLNAAGKGGPKKRIIRLQREQLDPLEPAKFRVRKQPPRSSSPPAPVLQSPPKKLTREEAAAWKIPPCVSNWKNIKGFTIPLDKRVAADGRRYESHTINSRFSAFSTTLYEAENVARENVRLRGEQLKKIAQQKRIRKEHQLEEEARNVIGIVNESGEKEEPSRDIKDYTEPISSTNDITNDSSKSIRYSSYKGKTHSNQRKKSPRTKNRQNNSRTIQSPHGRNESNERQNRKRESEAKYEREQLRRERLREMKREMRQEERRNKRGFSHREKERDITERMALGQTIAKGNEAMYDSRLFNNDEGVGSGFKGDDAYDLYDRPLFESVSSKVYRPKENGEEIDEEKDENGLRRRRNAKREEKPVEFMEEEKQIDDLLENARRKSGNE